MTATIATANASALDVVRKITGNDKLPTHPDGSVDWCAIAVAAAKDSVALQNAAYTRQAVYAYAYAQDIRVTVDPVNGATVVNAELERAWSERFRAGYKGATNASDEAAKKMWQRVQYCGRMVQRSPEPVRDVEQVARVLVSNAGRLPWNAKRAAANGARATAGGQGVAIDRGKAVAAVGALSQSHEALAAFVETLRMTAEQRRAWAGLTERHDSAARALLDVIGA